MGARLVEKLGKQPLNTLLDPEAIRKLGKEGIEIEALDDVKKESDGTLSYKGHRVVLYIRDVNQVRENQSLPRFHVSFCQMLEKMRAHKRWHRYVVANPNNEQFIINWVDDNISRSEKLDICQYCLTTIQWRDFSYSKTPKVEKRAIVREFKLEDFFQVYPRDLMSILPKYTADNAPINDYTTDFESVRQRIIVTRNGACDECGLNLSGDTKWLHVHHEDGNKANNNDKNLTLLCYDCHAHQPYHSHMKGIARHKDFKQKYGVRYTAKT
jgi:hypothetical protein